MTVTPPAAGSRRLRVGLLGVGTVGGAVAERLLDETWRRLADARGTAPPQLIAVGGREPSRRRAVPIPESVHLTDDLDAVVDRGDIDVVVELLGGLQPAGALVAHSLERGKAVVTANKALLAEIGPALEHTARRTGAALRFEAAVGSGIPILAPLARDLAANRLQRVRGIVNGTTNFILDAMHDAGTSYADALAEAQGQGYAEAQPAADVEGLDASHKLVLLARLAFGTWLQPSVIGRAPATVAGEGRAGITGVDRAAVTAAREQGLALKLVASVSRASGQGDSRLVAWVEPCVVAAGSLLGRTRGVTNVLEVLASPLGRVSFQGPGAGGDATSSAVLGDILALARGEGSTWGALPEATPAGELDDGRSEPGRWFHVSTEGRGSISGRMLLDDLRQRLRRAGAPPDTTIYRLLEDD